MPRRKRPTAKPLSGTKAKDFLPKGSKISSRRKRKPKKASMKTLSRIARATKIQGKKKPLKKRDFKRAIKSVKKLRKRNKKTQRRKK